MAGRLTYWIREIMGIQIDMPSMASYDEVIDMLNFKSLWLYRRAV